MATLQVADKPTLDAVLKAVDSIKSNNYASVVPINIDVSGLPLDTYNSIYKATGSGKIMVNHLFLRVSGNVSVSYEAYMSIDGGEKIRLRPTTGYMSTFFYGGFSEICFKKSIEFFVRGTVSSTSSVTIGAVLGGALFMQ